MVTKDQGRPEIGYWINEGSDIVLADPQFGTSTDDALTTAGFAGPVDLSHVGSARLICVSTAASGGKDDENRITFNDAEWANPMNGGSSGISVADLPVLPGLKRDENLRESGVILEGKREITWKTGMRCWLSRYRQEWPVFHAPIDSTTGTKTSADPCHLPENRSFHP